MSLDELKKVWDDLGEPTISSGSIDDQIENSLRSSYRSFVKRFFILDLCMLLFYGYTIILTIFRFEELDMSYLRMLGVASITILVILMIVRIVKIARSLNSGYTNYSHVKAIQSLATQITFRQRFQLAHIVLGFLLSISLAIIYIKIYNEYDLVQMKSFWFILIPTSLSFILFLNHWIKKQYITARAKSERLLKELN